MPSTVHQLIRPLGHMTVYRSGLAMLLLRLVFIVPLALADLTWLEKQIGTVTAKPTEPPVEPTNGCGYSFNEPPRWRVVHGVTAGPHTFPWLAPLQRPSNQVCGANILNRRWLLTAAHCFQVKEAFDNPFLYHITPGDHEVGTFSDTGGRQQQFRVKKYITHPDYIGHSDSYKHDLALVQLSADLDYSERVQPVCLPKKGQNFERNGACFIAGWGKDLGTIKAADKKKLQILHEEVRSWSECKSIWKHVLDDAKTQICYGNGNPTPCSGDSGGGLMCKDGKHWRLAGIASFVYAGCKKLPEKGLDRPAVYIDVSKYIDWIEDTLEKEAKEQGVSVRDWE